MQTEIKDMGADVLDQTDPLCDRNVITPECGAGNRFVPRAAGNDLIQAPENKFTLNATYELETGIGDWLLSATWMYSDEQNYSIFADADRTGDSWNRVDLRTSWTSPEGCTA